MLKKFMCTAALALLTPMAAHAGAVLIVRTNGSASWTYYLQSLHQTAGNTVTISTSIPLDLSGYDQVWDLGYNTLLNAADQALYLGFLQDGGGLFLAGEVSSMPRNNSILELIDAAGGGSIGGVVDCTYSGLQNVHAPFDGPNAVSTVSYYGPGCFSDNGTGQWITSSADGGSGIAFGVGDLANAPTGVLASILDINFLSASYSSSPNLTMNLISFLDTQATPPTPPTPPTSGVPEPGIVALLGIGLAGLGVIRRRNRSGAV
jgi:hypothetical protein